MRHSSHAHASPTEKLGLRFEPDVLIQQKYTDICRPNIYLEPEKMLMLAVLEDAVFCFQRFCAPANRREREIFRDAEAWFWDNRRDWPYSFANVCQFLGFDVEYLRQGLLRWKKHHRLESSPKVAQGYIGPRPYHSAR
jgi:hypothetical protein